MTMRITTADALIALTSPRDSQRNDRPGTGLLRRINHYTLWAFNPQRELTSRYDRAA
jgi:hypothetical protein